MLDAGEAMKTRFLTERATWDLWLERLALITTGLMFAAFGVSAYLEGSSYGAFIAFAGMLVWACAVKDYQEMHALAKKALRLCDLAIKEAEERK